MLLRMVASVNDLLVNRAHGSCPPLEIAVPASRRIPWQRANFIASNPFVVVRVSSLCETSPCDTEPTKNELSALACR